MDRVADDESKLWRIFGRLCYGGIERLTVLLHEFVLKNKSDFAALRGDVRKYKGTSLESDAWKATSVSGGGELSVVVLRESDVTLAALDRWLQHTGGATLLNGLATRPVDSVHEAYEKKSWWDDRALIVPRNTQNPTHALPSEAVLWTTDEHIATLAAAYPWSLCRWVSTYHERALAFVSRRSRSVETFLGIARQCGSDLLSVYQGIDTFEAVSRGLVFEEKDDFGTAALVAGDTERVAPWLVLEIHAGSGAWWQETAACLTSLAIGVSHDRYQRLLVAYRVDDRDAYRQIWRRLESESNVALAVVSGRTSPDRALQAFDSIHTVSFREMASLSRKLGWVYTHVWGGGSSEQHAMFHAQDPVITSRVRDYAMAQIPNDWGVWGSW